MYGHTVAASVPLLLLIALAVWRRRMKKLCPSQLPPDPQWPFSEDPGLALELAGSLEFVDTVLGGQNTDIGGRNRESAIRLQKLDFVLIPLYVAFLAVAAVTLGGAKLALPVIGCAILAGIFDVAGNLQIIRMAKGVANSSARRFGQLKWLFYFAAVGAEGVLLFFIGSGMTSRGPAGMALGAVLVLTGIGGLIPALRGAFAGIASVAKLSLFVFAPLALMPLILYAPFSWRAVIEFAFLMRVPVLTGAVVVTLPFIAFFTGAKSLLKGLFDLTAPSLFVVTLTSLAVSGSACMNASVILFHSSARFRTDCVPDDILGWPWMWLVIMAVLSSPVILTSLGFSARQKRAIAPLAVATLGGFAVALVVARYLVYQGTALGAAAQSWLNQWGVESSLARTGLFHGYVDPLAKSDPWVDHLSAMAAFAAVLILYAAVGLYGYWRLGKSRTVPALASALMLVMMLCWMLSAASFFFDQWRVPLLLIVLVAGTLTAQSAQADSFYHLRERINDVPAPGPVETIAASGVRRVIVVAANGGGIQAGAWAAQVLYGLHQDCGEPFARSLRMISSVSGGSVGSACFVHWLANRDSAKEPPEAASASSLDEVAWGLGWTDLLRALLPWVFGWLIGRGRALEKAWRLNCTKTATEHIQLDLPLSSWNGKVAAGQLPGIVMNATVAETGERLLLATTGLGQGDIQGRARLDAAELHRINGRQLDVGIVTAARLSASFPYVTPAARSDAPGPQPHVVDGGYYDNYGMATMVEWLDAALSGAGEKIESVLVIQALGAPVDQGSPDERHYKSRGWFYQAIAPLTTLAAVRSSGQIAHNNIELGLLQQKWIDAGIAVHSTKFEFNNPDAPLSWHLTPQEVRNIGEVWRGDMTPCRQLVREFLGGSDNLGCGCPRCVGVPRP